MRGFFSRRRRFQPPATPDRYQQDTTSFQNPWETNGASDQTPLVGYGPGAPMAHYDNPLRRRGCFSLTALIVHAFVAFVVLSFLFLINVVFVASEVWVHWVAWAWSMVYSVHLGASISNRRLLTAHIGLFLTLSGGLIGIDLAQPGDVWSPWAVLGLGISVLLHAGISFARHPPAILHETAPQQVKLDTVPPPELHTPVAIPEPIPYSARTGTSFGMKVVSVGLGAFALVAVAGAVWSGIHEASQLEGSGVVAVESVSVDPFDRIEISGDADITVRTGAVPAVTITGDDNFVPLVETNVSNGRLRVSMPVAVGQDIRYGVPMRYDIVVPSLTELRLRDGTNTHVELAGDVTGLSIFTQGGATVTVEAVMAEDLTITARGHSTITVSGTATRLQLTSVNLATVEAKDLIAQDVTVEVRHLASATVTATVAIDGRVSDQGTVQYEGDPTVEVEVTGMGAVMPWGTERLNRGVLPEATPPLDMPPSRFTPPDMGRTLNAE